MDRNYHVRIVRLGYYPFIGVIVYLKKFYYSYNNITDEQLKNVESTKLLEFD